MKRFIPSFFLLLALTGCFSKSAEVHFKVIPQVEIGGKIFEGSTVMSVEWTKVENSALGYGGSVKEYGEAVVVDLKEHGKLIVLPKDLETRFSVGEIYPEGLLQTFGLKTSVGSLDDAEFATLEALKPGQRFTFSYFSHVAGKNFWPTMLTMSDLSNPATVTEVTRENFSSIFGVDAKFKDLIIEVTDEPVTTDSIIKTIPILHDRKLYWTQAPNLGHGPNLPSFIDWPLSWRMGPKYFYTERTWQDGK